MENKKKIEIIEVKPSSLKTIDSVLEGMKDHYKALPHPLEVNPYRVIYGFHNSEISFGYRVLGGYYFTGEFTDGFPYTIKAEKSEGSLVLHEPVLGYYDHTIFGTEHIKDLERAKKRLKEKAFEIAEKVVLRELADNKTIYIVRGGVQLETKARQKTQREIEKLKRFSKGYIFDATNLDEGQKQELRGHPFFKIFFN